MNNDEIIAELLAPEENLGEDIEEEQDEQEQEQEQDSISTNAAFEAILLLQKWADRQNGALSIADAMLSIDQFVRDKQYEKYCKQTSITTFFNRWFVPDLFFDLFLFYSLIILFYIRLFVLLLLIYKI